MNAGRAEPVSVVSAVERFTQTIKTAPTKAVDEIGKLRSTIQTALQDGSKITTQDAEKIVHTLKNLKTTLENYKKTVHPAIYAPFNTFIQDVETYAKKVTEKAKTVNSTTGAKGLGA